MRAISTGLTYDDVLLIPGASEILPADADVSTCFSRNVSLNIPLVSAAMDTVTEAPMAIALAQLGGIGVIHKNLSIERQAEEVARVKRYEAGVVNHPVTVTPEMSLDELRRLAANSGISGYPVIDAGGVLVGVVTGRDQRFAPTSSKLVKDVMTPLERLVTIKEGSDFAQARDLMHKHRLERVLVVSNSFELRGIVTAKDMAKSHEYPNAAKDSIGRLKVAASIGTTRDDNVRFEKLVEAGVDAVVIDTAHGHSHRVLEQVDWAKRNYPNVDVVAGNIVTGEAALALYDCGADAVNVGMGPGSICTTRVVAGIGVPQLTALLDVADALWRKDIPIIADGGIRYSGDIAKALAAGATSVMVGGLLAGTDEAPGEIFHFGGHPYKSYRGMGSISAMKQGSADRYLQDAHLNANKLVPEGIEGRVEYKGAIGPIVQQLIGGLRASMGYCGTKTVKDMPLQTEFVQMSSAGMRESHVHDVQITQEAPNYR
ncbi:inosine-5-monophosphate dehydrogenase [Robbsia andropogonis]|uniref:Inosine-5'-monophosphate dehydrogenase n=1 Tax=Robbsia andropogonis TaxID=28092 RepID=A0A0F5JTS1_9BURK|nr:IMP dehydrogenase [Robbsia andropogonis]KKB61035.1 inosine-5-monophosphate dehydrogenase [Robbsia andropogonis]